MSFGLCNHCGEDFDKFEARKLEAATKEASCAGQATLVSSQASLHRAIREQDQTPVPQTFNASFKRSGTSSAATCSNGECSESASLEMPRLSENGKGYCRLLPTLWKLLGLLLGQELCAPECAAGSLCGLWESEMAVTNARQQSSASPRRRRKPSQSPRRRSQTESKGKQKGGKQKSKETSGKGKGNAAETAPVQYKTLAPPAPPQVTNPFASSAASATTLAAQATSSSSPEVQQMLQAIKLSYPDPSQIPSALQQWTTRLGETEDKDRTRNLHKETTRLGQAQKLLRETRAGAAGYEAQWKDHVVNALELLKEQKEAFMAQREQLADMERKAIIELNGARRAIAKLNKAEEKTTATEEEEAKEEVEEQALMEISMEDTSLKPFIEQFAESVGLAVTIAATHNAAVQDLTQQSKRPRQETVFQQGSAQSAAAQQK